MNLPKPRKQGVVKTCGINVPGSERMQVLTWPCHNAELIAQLRAEIDRLQARLEQRTAEANRLEIRCGRLRDIIELLRAVR